MSFWSPTFVILIAFPFAVSRHVDHSNSKRTEGRHEDNSKDVDDSWLFPKSHLRLHEKPPKILHAKEGGSEVLECQAGGTPLPTIYWLKNGQQLSKIDLADELEVNTPEGEENEKLNIGSTVSKLYLDCLTMSDEAEYSCIAESANLRESSTTRVSVSSSDDGSCHNKKQYGKAPRILSWTKTVLENQGEDLKVTCRVDGDPKPKLKWINPNEDEISTETNSKYHISSNGDLLIRNLKWRDMGNYICVAENIHGSARAEIFVYPASPET